MVLINVSLGNHNHERDFRSDPMVCLYLVWYDSMVCIVWYGTVRYIL